MNVTLQKIVLYPSMFLNVKNRTENKVNNATVRCIALVSLGEKLYSPIESDKITVSAK